MPAFSVIIVNYNAGDYLLRTVDALLAQTFSAFEAFVVDNGSTDGSLDELPNDKRLTVIEAGDNLGFAAGNNLAAKRARADWIVTLNPDAFAQPDWLAALARAIPRNPHVAMLGSMQVMAEDDQLWDGTGDELSVYGVAYRAGHGHARRTFTDDFPVFGPCAAAAAYRRDYFERAGGFEERFFCYHEDVDLALKIRRLGGRCVQVHDAVVHHVGGGTAGDTEAGASPFAVYHGTRNRIWMWALSMPKGLAIALAPLTIAANLAYLLWSMKRPARFKPTARGVWHGITGLPKMIGSRRRYPKGTKAIWGVLVRSPGAVLARRNRVGR